MGLKLIIDPEFRDLIPPLSKDEFELLEKNIITEGCRDAIVTWRMIIIDGHNRYSICTKHDIPYKVMDSDFKDRHEVIDWIIDNQLGRRNITPEARLYLIGKKYKEEKKQKGAPEGNKNAQKQMVQNGPFVFTVEKIAEQYKIGETTVKRAEQYADAVTIIANNTGQDIKDKILSRDSRLTQKEVLQLAKESPEEQKKIVEMIEDGEVKNYKEAKKLLKQEKKESVPENLPPITDRYKIFHSDIASMNGQIRPGSIDAIITDPPYPKEYLHLYEALAKKAKEWLKPGGSLLVMCGQSYLPEIFNLMTPHLQYHWVVAYLTPGGQSAQLWDRNVNTFWKPVLWFTNGKYEGDWIGDVVRSDVNDNDKRFHEWGQSESGVAELVKRFSDPGNTILDPFLGGGTTGVVAISMNRKFVGIDVDEEAVTTSLVRLNNLYVPLNN